MGLFEELQVAQNDLSDRLARLEGMPSSIALRDRLAVFEADRDRVEAEGAALSRRMHAVESESNQAQHGEIQALGRRVAKVEELDTTVRAISGLLTEEAIARSAQDEVLLREVNAMKDALLNTMATAFAAQDKELLALKGWRSAQEAWDAQPWYRRWWRLLRGER